MANGQYNYNIKVKASADKASFDSVKKSLEDVLAGLNSEKLKLMTKDQGTGMFSKELKDIKKLTKDVQEFQKIFKGSYNSDLGAINLTEFNKQLSGSKVKLENVYQAYNKMGAAGKQGFRELTAEILSTNRNLQHTTTFLDNMATTMGNTIKWGISSSVMNSFTGSIEKAYGYVKNLDKSLNEIRIVSGKSADEMERFADQANKAAQGMGATTLDYTNASLIYYQQGLAEEEVESRTNTTLKMANVLGASASEVSDYMTAIWNNFYDGSKSLEYYADVITKLGAATASSAEEISTGLEKFAAISETVGLSYEYATAALTTVTATTRQSAEVVGTAFKTLFARIQDLELGETLDDGTTLGKYSEALEKVGISIMDSNGELRDMDNILDDMGSKWDTLTKAQQVSLAQTVAGTRQYTQLVALMDNWDSFSENLNTARDATGSLDEQQEIYMDSAEAHLNAMSAAWEDLYDSVLDEDTIKDFADALKLLANSLTTVVDGLGGGGNTLLALGSIATRVFSKNIAQGLSGVVSNFKRAKDNAAILNAELEIMEKYGKLKLGDETTKSLVEMKQQVLKYGELVSNEQQNELDHILNTTVELQQQKEAWDENIEAARKYAAEILAIPEEEQDNFKINVDESKKEDKDLTTEETTRRSDNLDKSREALDTLVSNLKPSKKEVDSFRREWDKLTTTLSKTDILDEQVKLLDEFETQLTTAVGGFADVTPIAQGTYNDLTAIIMDTHDRLNDAKASLGDGSEAATQQIEALKNQLQILLNSYSGTLAKIEEQNPAQFLETLNQETLGQTAQINKNIDTNKGNFKSLIDSIELTDKIDQFSKFTGSITQTASGFMALVNIVDIWNNEDLTGGEKVVQIVSAIATGLPMIVSGIFGIAASAGTAIPAIVSLGTAIWGALAPILPIILAVVGAIAVLSVGVYALVKAWNADADAAKSAAEQAQHLTEVYEDLKNKAEELKKTISEYNEAHKAMEELTDDAEGYKEALEQANEAAKQLIETYGLYDDYYMEGGAIKFKDGVLEGLQSQADIATREAETNMYSAKINANVKQNTSDATDLGRKIGSTVGTGVYDSYGYEYTRNFENSELEATADALNKVREASEDEYDAIVATEQGFKDFILNSAEVPQTVKDNVDAIVENKKSILEFTNSLNKAAEANLYYAEQIMQNMIEEKYGSEITKLATDEEGKVNESRQAQITAIMTASSEERTKELNEKLENLDLSDKWSSNNALNKNYGYDIDNDEDLARTYAKEILNKTDEEIAAMDYDGHVGAGTLKTSDGTKVLDKYDDKMMREQLARKARQDELKAEFGEDLNSDAQLEALTDLVEGAQEAGKKYGTDFTDAVLNSLTAEDHKMDLSGLFGQIDPNEANEIMAMDTATILKTFGMDEESIKEAGYASSEEFVRSIKDGLKDYKWDAEAALDGALQGKDEELEAQDLETEELKNYAKYLMDIADSSDEFADSLKYDAESAVIVTKSIQRMNNGVEKLAEGFEDWSDVLKNSSKESEEYYDALTNMQDAVADLLDTEDEYVTDSFVQEHMEEIGKAAEGDAEAIDNLHKALAKDIVLNIAANNELAEADIQSLTDMVNNLEVPDIEVGASMNFDEMNTDQQEFARKMMEIVQKAKMTTEEANAFFGQMGFEAKFATKKEKVKQSVPVQTTESQITSVFPLKMTSRTYQSGTEEFEQEVEVPAFSTDGKDPVINITKKGGGSLNNFSSKNKGGGDAGGGSDPKVEEGIESTLDIYHDVNVRLNKLGDSFNRLEKQKQKLFGTDLINNINQQLGILNKQIDTTGEKLEIAKGEAAGLQSELASKGMTFNADGTIANYADVYNQQLAYVNSVIDKYNSLDAKGQESYQGTLDAAKENWEKFLEDMDRYDELVTDFIPELEDDVQEAVNQKIELQVEAFNMEMEIRLDLSEAEREWNDFKKRIIDGIDEEDILGNTKARLQDFSTYYNTEGTGSIQAGTGHVNDILAQLAQIDSTGWSDVYGDNRTQALEDLKTYYTQLMSDMTDLQALSDEIHESYMDMMDEAQEKFDEQIEAYETIGSLIEHDMNVISLVYGEESYGALSQFYEKQEENNNKALDFQRQQVDFWRQQMDTLEEGSEEWEKAKENWLSAVDTWNAKVEEAIENLQDKYLNAINLIFQNLNNNITDGLGLEYVSEEWDLINQNADKYLDTINSLYETQALENKYLDAIDQTDNVSAQRQLKKLMDQEITALREKDKLTQYDIERANMKYEIALKQIALEEAQQNKSNMRLRRDSQGNYSYQFVADDEGIADAEQELSDLYNSLYNFDKENYQSNLDEIYSVWEEFQSKMAEAAQINDPEAREARELLLKEQYGELINGIVAENEVIRNNLYDSAFTDLADLYNVDVENFQQMADAEKEILMSDLLPYWDSGVQHMADAFAGEDGFLGICKDAFAELDQATKDYEDGLIEIQDNAGQSFEEIKEGVDETIVSTEELVEDNNELIESYNNELEAIDSVIDELDLLIEKYDKAAEAAKKATEEAYKYWQQENKDAADSAGDNKDSIGKDNENKGTNTNTNTNTPTTTSDNSGSNTNSLGTASNGAPFIDSYTIKNGDTLSGIGARYGVAWRRIYEENKSTIGSNPNLIHAGKTLKIPKYDTGGYTGEWSGNSGQLAMLHEKELVLNANDTRNMLSAMEILREITLGSSIFSRLAAVGANASIVNGGFGDTLEQNVHIDASFPNVTNSHEIEDAINNLMNVATQRINRR